MPKRPIRAQFLARRKALARDASSVLSKRVQERFLQSSAFRESGCISLYSPIHNEVQTDEIARLALHAGKSLAYPRVCKNELEFVRVLELSDLAPGAFDVLEPVGASIVAVSDLDLIVVPGVVFDRGGHRLGYGRGYYDRTLAECRSDCLTVGLAYDFQLLADLPTGGHDRPLSMIMTETKTLDFSTW